MTNEHSIPIADLAAILTHYDIGQLRTVQPLTAGTVQTNLLVETTNNKVVLRLYRQNRSFAAVGFEIAAINHLKQHGYPCPAVFGRCDGGYVGVYKGMPCVLFEFLEGEHVAEPTAEQEQQLIQKVAEMQLITQGYCPEHTAARWNYDVPFCEEQAVMRAAEIGTAAAAAKLAWYRTALAQLQLPVTHPKGICHCDFHFSNVLFKDGRFHALLDFDDANYTYLTFDLVSLVEPHLFRFRWDNWLPVQPGAACFDFVAARKLIAIYAAVRPLQAVEQHHFFDVLKLATLIDCLWFFARGDVDSFFERRKIECLDALGREEFTRALFL